MLQKIEIETQSGENLIDLTAPVQAAVQVSGVQEGVCVVFAPHSTAALTLNSTIDQKTAADIVTEVRRIVPTRVDFQHVYDTPADAAGHIKSVLVGNSLSLIISQGRLLLGHSQSILFYEFDGPRARQVWVRIIEDK